MKKERNKERINTFSIKSTSIEVKITNHQDIHICIYICICMCIYISFSTVLKLSCHAQDSLMILMKLIYLWCVKVIWKDLDTHCNLKKNVHCERCALMHRKCHKINVLSSYIKIALTMQNFHVFLSLNQLLKYKII